MTDIRKEIEKKLSEIEEREHVTILHAVESGSRAWGIASPDSDYDVRFIYVRTRQDYLKLNEPKDVIEWQLDDRLDINGWDLKKTLKQFHKGNATLFEWSNSPIVYKTTTEWKQIYEEANTYFSVKSAVYHYYGTANHTYSQYLQENLVNYKKYFYALRPLLAGIYIQKYQSPPPVLFADLLKIDLSKELQKEIETLLEIKKKSNEKEKGIPFPMIKNFIEEEIKKQKNWVENRKDDRKREWEELDHIFLKILDI